LNFPANKRKLNILSNELLIAFVFGITATAISPNIVSGLVVATVTFSEESTRG
jgi:hypothetical protein